MTHYRKMEGLFDRSVIDSMPIEVVAVVVGGKKVHDGGNHPKLGVDLVRSFDQTDLLDSSWIEGWIELREIGRIVVCFH